MNALDELRKFYEKADGYEMWKPKHKVELDSIADRIEAELAERYVALPLDADGEVIHIGDSVEIIGGEYGTAVAIELCEDGGWNVSMRPTGWDTPTLFAAESVRHYTPPTVEDVLREMIDELFVDVYADPDTIAEYAKRLRLAGEDE